MTFTLKEANHRPYTGNSITVGLACHLVQNNSSYFAHLHKITCNIRETLVTELKTSQYFCDLWQYNNDTLTNENFKNSSPFAFRPEDFSRHHR